MYQNIIYICISWCSKICWFPMKNVDFSRNQEVCHVIHVFFASSLAKRYNCAKFHHFRICVTEFREGAFLLPSIHEQSRKSPFWIGLKLAWFNIGKKFFHKLDKYTYIWRSKAWAVLWQYAYDRSILTRYLSYSWKAASGINICQRKNYFHKETFNYLELYLIYADQKLWRYNYISVGYINVMWYQECELYY